MRLEPLDRDYWPESVEQPYLRLAVASIATPAAAALATTLFVLLIELIAPYEPQRPYSGPLSLFIELALGMYVFAAVALGPGFVLLWSMRLRSPNAYIFTGLIGGVIAAYLTTNGPSEPTPLQFGLSLGAGVLMALLLRAAAGIQREM